MTDSSLPQRTPLTPAPPAFDDREVRRFVTARAADVYVDFQAHHATLLALVDRPEAEIMLDAAPEDDLLRVAGQLERPRRLVRHWRLAMAPEGSDAYARLQEARRVALDALTAPEDPLHREAQGLERAVARTFYCNTTDECLAYWIETGEVLALEL